MCNVEYVSDCSVSDEEAISKLDGISYQCLLVFNEVKAVLLFLFMCPED